MKMMHSVFEPSVYKYLIEDKKVKKIIDELNRHSQKSTETFLILCNELFAFEEVDNEMNRITGKIKLDGPYYISALLFYVAIKGWIEPFKALVHLGGDIRLVMINDDSCKRDMVDEKVNYLVQL